MKRTVAPDSTTPAKTSAAIAASSSAPASPASCARVADLRAVAEDAQRPGQRGGRRRLPRQAKQHRVGDAAGDDLAEIGRGGRRGGEAASRRLVEQLSDEERVPARHLEAGADEPIVRLARPAGRRRARRRPPRVSGGRTQHLRGGIADERRRLGRQRGIERPRREDERERHALEPARDEREGRAPTARRTTAGRRRRGRAANRRRGSRPASRGRDAGIAGIARGWTRRRRLGGARGAPMSTSRGQRRRPGKPALALGAVGLQQRALEELADDPEREPLLELRRPRAQDPEAEVRRPARVPPRAAATSPSRRRPR